MYLTSIYFFNASLPQTQYFLALIDSPGFTFSDRKKVSSVLWNTGGVSCFFIMYTKTGTSECRDGEPQSLARTKNWYTLFSVNR